MNTEERQCAKCGGAMEAGFLYNAGSLPDENVRGNAEAIQVAGAERLGWMSGDAVKREHPDAWVNKGNVVNQRHKIIAWRCTSCAVVELTAG
jgi:hypothetical protein